MRRVNASFAIRLLSSDAGDRPDVDRALAIFVRNTSPLLRTKTNQIRTKIAFPETPEGRFYFAALYRNNAVIGFAMFGYYPRSRLIAVDHLVIDGEQRGDAAFYVFAQLLQDVIQSLEVEVDFTAVELEKGTDFGGNQTGGTELARLLGQVGFGQVHLDYVLANMEPHNYEARYNGILMLRGAQKLYRIRREDLLDVYRSILFEHYLPWYRDFFGDKIYNYQKYLEKLHEELDQRLRSEPVVKVNGPESNVLISQPMILEKSTEAKAVWSVAIFAAAAAIITAAIYVLQPPTYMIIPIILGILLVFVGILAASNGRAFDIFDRVMSSLSSERRKSRYQQPSQTAGKPPRIGQERRNVKKNLPDQSVDTPD